MNGWDNLKIYEGRVTIPFVTLGISSKLAETRYRLDDWIATLNLPPKNMTQTLRLVKLTGVDVTYELTIREREPGEPRGIL